MRMLSGTAVWNEYLTSTLHEKTQVEDHSVSLTASSLHEIAESGDLDFGGSELKLASRRTLERQKRNPEDDYGWWELSAGDYLLELNENLQLEPGASALLQPHFHLLWNGAFHPTLSLTSEDSGIRLIIPLRVGSGGISIKENARVSTLQVFE